MRRFSFLVLLLVAKAAAAQAPKQQFEFNMVNDAFMAGSPFPGSMKSAAHWLSDGTRTRVDVIVSPPMGGRTAKSTMIMNSATRKTIMIDADAKEYYEMAMPDHSATTDSIKKIAAAQGLPTTEPEFKATGEHKTINGFEAERRVTSMTLGSGFPFPKEIVKEGNVIAMVMEQWSTDDARLAGARVAFKELFAKQFQSPSPMPAPELDAFPLETTNMMVQVPAGAQIDAEALLKAGYKADGVIMMMTMRIEDVRVMPLDPARFEVPKGLKKREMKLPPGFTGKQ